MLHPHPQYCDPGWIRTNDRLLRRQVLYPAELQDQFELQRCATKKGQRSLTISFVGAARFELTTSCSQSRRDTGLRYAPKFLVPYWIADLPA
jgi:hypothetical protein